MRTTVKTVGTIMPFVIIIIVVGWFVITRPPPTENQESMPEKSQPGATEDPNDVIFTCRNAAQLELRPVNNLDNSTNEDAGRTGELLSSCDKQMLLYRNQCQENPSKSYCNNPALDGYFILRKI